MLVPRHLRTHRKSAGVAVVVTGAGAVIGGLLATSSAGAVAVSSYTVTKQVADTASAGAGTTDKQLVNAWGLAQSPSGPVWVANNGTSTSTVYGSGAAPTKDLSVAIKGEDPSGEVFNPTSGFTVGAGHEPAEFIFDSETGKLSGWAGGASTVVAAGVPKAVFKGLAMAKVNKKPRLFATDFHHGVIDVFDSTWKQLPTKGFVDSQLPKGYAPFGIMAAQGKLYVSYAKQDSQKHDDVAGAGNGYVDLFSTQGGLLARLVSRGALNSPWGMTIAPTGFGSFAGDLLVGNFGDGVINVYDPSSGAALGALTDDTGSVLALPGLWGLLPGNGMTAPVGSVQFSAGPGGESHGLLGYLSVASTPASSTPATDSPSATPQPTVSYSFPGY
jgi:uncharacterized protein (TIGR03118 family)